MKYGLGPVVHVHVVQPTVKRGGRERPPRAASSERDRERQRGFFTSNAFGGGGARRQPGRAVARSRGGAHWDREKRRGGRTKRAGRPLFSTLRSLCRRRRHDRHGGRRRRQRRVLGRLVAAVARVVLWLVFWVGGSWMEELASERERERAREARPSLARPPTETRARRRRRRRRHRRQGREGRTISRAPLVNAPRPMPRHRASPHRSPASTRARVRRTRGGEGGARGAQ